MKKPHPRERILAVAHRLFYAQGIPTTGVNQIIAEAETTKATFYRHFASKDALVEAYAQRRIQLEWDEIHRRMAAFKTAKERFFAPLELLPTWMEAADFQGCTTHLLVAQLPGPDHPAWATAVEDKAETRRWLRALTLELSASGEAPRAFAIEPVVDAYVLMFDGALALAKILRSPAPFAQASRVLRAMTGFEGRTEEEKEVRPVSQSDQSMARK